MNNEVISALPTGGLARAPVLRDFLIRRVIYTFSTTEDPKTFNALDPDTGALPQALGFNSTVFWLDPNDTTSAHDGVAVVKTVDNYRYKANPIDNRTLSVLNFTTTTPPVTPSLGDTYLVPAGATGAWSSHQDDIAKWTPHGWDFEIARIGRWLLDQSIGGFIAYTATGWKYGPGARSFDDASIPFSAALGWGARFEVESQTVVAPPTATKGLRYVVGPSATGGWLGKDKKVAICEIAGQWRFYDPSDGWVAFDKSVQSDFRWSAATSAWISAAGSWVGRLSSPLTLTGSTTAPSGTTMYAYSNNVAPTTAQRRLTDGVPLVYTAKKAGAVLRFDYTADAFFPVGVNAIGSPNAPIVIALYRDSVVNAVAWKMIQAPVMEIHAINMGLSAPIANFTPKASVREFFEYQSPDTAQHTYSIGILSGVQQSQAFDANSLTRRLFTVQEAA